MEVIISLAPEAAFALQYWDIGTSPHPLFLTQVTTDWESAE